MGLFSWFQKTYNKYVLANGIKRGLEDVFCDWYEYRPDWSEEGNGISVKRAKYFASFLRPSKIKYVRLKDEINRNKFGHFSMNPDVATIFSTTWVYRNRLIKPISPELFVKRRIFIPDLQSISINGKTTAEVGEYIVHTYGNTFYVPGLEYYIWLLDYLSGPPPPEVRQNLCGPRVGGNRRLFIFFGSVFCNAFGEWSVPAVEWIPDRFVPLHCRLKDTWESKKNA